MQQTDEYGEQGLSRVRMLVARHDFRVVLVVAILNGAQIQLKRTPRLATILMLSLLAGSLLAGLSPVPSAFAAGGGEQPPLVMVSSTSATQATCDAHFDAEWVGNHCRFLAVQGAVDLADPGATIFVPMGTLLNEPTPRPESVTVNTPDLTICASTGGHVCARDVTPGFHEVRENMNFSTPPVLWQGEAIHLDTSVAPGHGSTSFYPPEGFQLGDITRLQLDFLMESGACGTSPRFAFWGDLNGNGARDVGETTFGYPDMSGCATGQWQHEDLINDAGATLWHPSVGNTDVAGAHAAMAASDPNYQIDSINVQFDDPNRVIWMDNVVVNGYVLAEDEDRTCVLTEAVACRNEIATRYTVIDGSSWGGPAFDIQATGVSLFDMTLRSNADAAIVLSATGTTIEGNIIQASSAAGNPFFGIDGGSVANGLAGLVVRDNVITPDPDDPGLIGEDAVRGRFVNVLIEGNTIEGWASGVRLRPYGDSTTVRDNTIVDVNTGITTWSPNTRIEGNSFANVAGQAVDVAMTPSDPSIDGVLLRKNDFSLVDTGVRLRATGTAGEVSDSFVDARLNRWAVDDYRVVALQVEDLGTNNYVPYLPYLDIEEPPFPRASSYTATPASCDAHLDAEWVVNHCRFFTVQAALDFADVGALVAVPMSAHPEDPTPRFETVSVTTDGITLCSSAGGFVCASDASPGRYEIRDNMAFGEPPVLWSGEAISLDAGAAPGHGSTSFFPADGFQIAHIDALQFDWMVESGACGGAGSPRIALWSDLDASGTRNAGETVLAYPDASGCVLGGWEVEDLLNDAGASFYHGSTGYTDASGAHGAFAAMNPAYQIDAINLQYDGVSSKVWFDNVRVNGFVLAEELDLSCAGNDDVPCRSELATKTTIVDGSSGNTVINVAANDVTVQGMTLRRTGDQSPGSTVVRLSGTANPAILDNKLEIEGGGCTADQVVLGGCFGDPQTTGISGSSTAAVVSGNRIAADYLSTETGELGGTNGFIGNHDSAIISGNVFKAWMANAIFGNGPDMTVSSNWFNTNRAAVMACGNAPNMQILGNEFLVHDTALKMCGPNAATGVEAHNNAIRMTNAIGLAVDAGIAGAVVDAECNDWGMYHNDLIQDYRIDDSNAPANVIDTDPFTSPEADPSLLQCLVGPTADFVPSTFTPLRGERVEFFDQSTPGSATRPVVDWEWDFGDGSTASGPGVGTSSPAEYGTIVHTYQTGGPFVVELRITDSQGIVSSTTQVIVVANGAPDLEAIADRVIGETQSLTVPLHATDPENDAMTLSASGLPSGATLTPNGNGKGFISWTPTLTQSGVYNIFVTVTDSGGDFDTESFTITVDDTVPVPGFDNLHDACILEVYETWTTMSASDPNGDPITLSASGLPAWGDFTDLGNGNGRFHWTAPSGIAGTSYTITVTASAGGDVAVGSFELCVVGFPDLELKLAGGPFKNASPGEVVEVDATVKNTGVTGATVDFTLASKDDWVTAPPASMFLPAGASALVTFEVTVPTDDRRSSFHMQASAPDYPGEVSDQYFIIEVPVSMDVLFDTHSAALGVRGVVVATFLNGAPASNVVVDLTERPEVNPYGFKGSTVSGRTNADGVFAFDFGLEPSARMPGVHTYEVAGAWMSGYFVDAGLFAVDAL